MYLILFFKSVAQRPIILPFFIYFIHFVHFLDWTSLITDLSFIVPCHFHQSFPNPQNVDCIFAVLLKMCCQRYSVPSHVLNPVFFTESSFSLTSLYHLTLLNIPSFLNRSFSPGFHNPRVPYFASFPSNLLSLISFMDYILSSNYLNKNSSSNIGFCMFLCTLPWLYYKWECPM